MVPTKKSTQILVSWTKIALPFLTSLIFSNGAMRPHHEHSHRTNEHRHQELPTNLSSFLQSRPR